MTQATVQDVADSMNRITISMDRALHIGDLPDTGVVTPAQRSSV
jgi:hypothetical protein